MAPNVTGSLSNAYARYVGSLQVFQSERDHGTGGL